MPSAGRRTDSDPPVRALHHRRRIGRPRGAGRLEPGGPHLGADRPARGARARAGRIAARRPGRDAPARPPLLRRLHGCRTGRPVTARSLGRPPDGGPLLLIAGGSGVAPLMAMIRTRAAAGTEVDTAAAVLTRLGRHHLPRRTPAAQRRRPHHRAHADRLTAARLDGICAPRRRRHAGRGRPGPRAAATHLRVRPDTIRRDGRRGAGAPGARAAAHQDRAVRADRKLTWTN